MTDDLKAELLAKADRAANAACKLRLDPAEHWRKAANDLFDIAAALRARALSTINKEG